MQHPTQPPSFRTRRALLVGLGVATLATSQAGGCASRSFNTASHKAIRSEPGNDGRSEGVYLAVPKGAPYAMLVIGCYDEGPANKQGAGGLKPPAQRVYLEDFESDALPLIAKEEAVPNAKARDATGRPYSGRCQILWGDPALSQSIKNKAKDFTGGEADGAKLRKLRLQLAANTVGNTDFMLKTFTALGFATASQSVLHDPTLALVGYAGMGFGIVKFAIDWKIAGIRREEESEITLKLEQKAHKRAFLNVLADVAQEVDGKFKAARTAQKDALAAGDDDAEARARVRAALGEQDDSGASQWLADFQVIAKGEDAQKTLAGKDKDLKKQKKDKGGMEKAAPEDISSDAAGFMDDETLATAEGEGTIEAAILEAQSVYAIRFARAFNGREEDALFHRERPFRALPLFVRSGDTFFASLRALEAVEKGEIKKDIAAFDSQRRKKKKQDK